MKSIVLADEVTEPLTGDEGGEFVVFGGEFDVFGVMANLTGGGRGTPRPYIKMLIL